MNTSPPADALPELPEPNMVSHMTGLGYYGDDQMRAYALSHAESLRAEVARLRNALSEMVEFFEPDAWGSSTNRADALAGARAALKEQA